MDSTPEERLKMMHATVAEELGRAVRVFKASGASASTNSVPDNAEEESDDFYNLTPEDYYHITSSERNKPQVLKTRRMREAEARARRNSIKKATIRVRFPDGYVLEAEFSASEKIQSLVDLLGKAVARPELQFYLYTTPPKQRVKDMSKDFYSAGFVPGAIVYFSYDQPQVADASQCQYLCSEVLALDGLLRAEQADYVVPEAEPAAMETAPVVPKLQTVANKTAKPKWFKL